MALVEQLGNDSCATCCHMALVFAIMHLYKKINFVFCLSILFLFLSLFFILKNLVSIDGMVDDTSMS